MTDRERAALEAALAEEPGDMCAACGAGCGGKPEPRWQPAARGAWLEHGSGMRKCRLPCPDGCEHKDCADLRSKLDRARFKDSLDKVLSSSPGLHAPQTP